MVILWRATLLAALLLAVAVSVPTSLWGSHRRGEEAAVIYVAPTLLKLASDAAEMLGHSGADLRVIGSVAALRLIQQGRVPDAYLTVDSELIKEIRDKQFKRLILGHFKLHLVCKDLTSLQGLGGVRIGVADPNTAPIGYRALAALYWLSTQYGYLRLEEIEEGLSASFAKRGDGAVIIDVRGFSAHGRFAARDDLAGVASLFEAGAVDCIFAHTPFIVYKRYGERFNVMELPPEIQFAENPPVRFLALTSVGEVEIKSFVAEVVSFSPAGDRFLAALERIDTSMYGLERY
jgi:molybdate/tungstate transport system substrate-binding protein